MAGRAKQALIAPSMSHAAATLGRIEIEGRWQKDAKRRLIVHVLPGQLAELELAIALFKQGGEMKRKAAEELAPRAEVQPARKQARRFKTIGDRT